MTFTDVSVAIDPAAQRLQTIIEMKRAQAPKTNQAVKGPKRERTLLEEKTGAPAVSLQRTLAISVGVSGRSPGSHEVKSRMPEPLRVGWKKLPKSVDFERLLG